MIALPAEEGTTDPAAPQPGICNKTSLNKVQLTRKDTQSETETCLVVTFNAVAYELSRISTSSRKFAAWGASDVAPISTC